MFVAALFVVFLSVNFCDCKNISNNTNVIQFLNDYFFDRNVTITAHLCWSQVDLRGVYDKFYKSPNPKMISIYRTFDATYFDYKDNNVFVLDLSCDDALRYLQAAETKKLFLFPHKWLLIDSKRINDQLTNRYIDLLKNFTIFTDNEIMCAENVKNEIVLRQFYRIRNYTEIIEETHGKWSERGLTYSIWSNITSWRRKYFYNVSLLVATTFLSNESINHIDDFKDPLTDLVTKVQVGSIINLAYYLNTNYTIIPTKVWGVPIGEGKWNGALGVLQRNGADLLGSGMFFWAERAKSFYYLKLSLPVIVQFVMLKPPLSNVKNLFILPFTGSLWIFSCLIIIIMSVSIYFSVIMENKKEENRKIKFVDVSLLTVSAICQQGSEYEPRSASGKTTMLFLYLFLLFLYTSYSANIVSLLQSSGTKIHTLEDLLHSPFKLGVADEVASVYMFKNAKDPLRKAIYEKKVGPNGFYSVDKGIELVRQGLFAFHSEMGMATYCILKTFKEHEKCNLQELFGFVPSTSAWTLVEKQSPFKEIFKIGLLKIEEYGIQRRFHKRFYRKYECSQSASTFTSVGIIDFYPVMVVFTFGVGLALFLLVIEIFLSKYMQRRIKIDIN